MTGTKRAVVIDNGPRRINAGFAGHHVMSATIPAVIGAPKYEGILFMNGEDDYTYGDEALASFRTHTLHHCLPGMGQKANWQYVEKLWNHIFSQRLQISPTDQPLLLTFSSSFSISDAAHIARIVFERLQAPALYIGLRCVLTLRSMRLDTGLVLEIGKDSSMATCVSNGLIVESSIEHSRNSYETILENCKQVSLGNERSTLIEDIETLQTDSVPRHAFIALDYRVELGKLRWPRDALYAQVDGASDRINGDGPSPGELNTRSFSKACFEAPEVLFQPKMFDFLLESLQELAVRSVQLCKSEDQPRLYNNVHLVGPPCLLYTFCYLCNVADWRNLPNPWYRASTAERNPGFGPTRNESRCEHTERSRISVLDRWLATGGGCRLFREHVRE